MINQFKTIAKISNTHLSLCYRNLSSKRGIILGIESSCDDTGCGIVDTDRNLLGDSLNSQHLIHLNNGGIIPTIANSLHRRHIEQVVQNALDAAKLRINDVDAIAATVKPGMPLSLVIGTKYGKYLCKKYEKPFIPIHHMEAHALTARMIDKTIEFPFLVLLISGGHCLLALAQNVDKFLLLGESIDDAPGEAFDKMARRMKLKNLREYEYLSGGQAIELAAAKAQDPLKYSFNEPMLQYKDCNFSFSGIKNVCLRYVIREEKDKDVAADGVIPGVNDLCAAFLLVVTKHLCRRVQRAMEFIKQRKLIPFDNQTLVVSGGVACNNFISEGLKIVCESLSYKLIKPPPHLCTDNGIMVAWNGAERWKVNSGVYHNFGDIEIEKTAPLGESIIKDIAQEKISCDWVKLGKLTKPQKEWE